MCLVSLHQGRTEPVFLAGARVNDVIAGRAVQSALVPASRSVTFPRALQVLDESHSESGAS